MDGLLYAVACAAGVLALLFAAYLARKIGREDPGDDKMREIADAIHTGAMAFLRRQYGVLIIFVAVLAVVIFVVGVVTKGDQSLQPATAISFIIGALCSVLAGNFGMRVATKANVRTANAAKVSGAVKALTVAFSGGSVMGMCVVGLGLVGLSAVILLVNVVLRDLPLETKASIINGYALGASSVALFGRVGGGIYTKAADVGADLVGKVEAGIPEDDPRNPAVIADNVGDNVGDVAGMGSDLFESFVGSIISAIALASVIITGGGSDGENWTRLLIAPILVAGIGTIASVIGSLFVRTKEGKNPARALNIGEVVSTVLAIAGIFAVSLLIIPDKFTDDGKTFTNMGVFFASISGLIVGFIIGKVTEYYTSADYNPVKAIAKSCETGTATNIISGIATGMGSTALPILLIVAAILIANGLAGLYGVAMAAVGMLCTTGMVVAVDAYGPISDNAGGIAEMAGLDKKVREITDKLDSVGNTTAAIGKGFAIGSAALTALALFSAYVKAVGLSWNDTSILDPQVVAGLFIGGMLPFLFSSMTMQAVGRAAQTMIAEVRRQFREITGLMEGKAKPDYSKCVDISAKAALREMIVPSLIAIIVPILVGVLPFLGAKALAGLLAGTLVSGFLLAIMMSNAGGAWDNAKKYIEEGNHGGKGSDAHSAAVNGDTVGDPFKDTSGPSINILIKLMTIIALVFAPMF
ncbi:MAG: sodium-translocating pyrophosphatase [Oscillospiraceae bacterium]|jgi:K(+)-stimulated pyrophosphate-energized sodium pump|nr:sodium-translocating pyrophosphatase [Oscillospiraceae bacterium]